MSDKQPAILPPPGPPGTTKAVPQLGALATTPAWETPVQRGRLPTEAGEPPLAQYGDVSPERPGDPGPTRSPPAPTPTLPQLKGQDRR